MMWALFPLDWIPREGQDTHFLQDALLQEGNGAPTLVGQFRKKQENSDKPRREA